MSRNSPKKLNYNNGSKYSLENDENSSVNRNKRGPRSRKNRAGSGQQKKIENSFGNSNDGEKLLKLNSVLNYYGILLSLIISIKVMKIIIK